MLFFLVALTFFSCNNPTPAEVEQRNWCLAQTDSLWIRLAETRRSFKFSMDEIAMRKEQMNSQLQVLKLADGNLLSPEEKSQIVQYNSVYRVYKPVAEKYKNLVLEAEDLFYRIKALEQSTKQGVYDKKLDEFKTTLEAIRKDLDACYGESSELGEKLASVEPMYVRLSPKIEELVTRFNPGGM